MHHTNSPLKQSRYPAVTFQVIDESKNVLFLGSRNVDPSLKTAFGESKNVLFLGGCHTWDWFIK
jgi:hypothetical protein